jgi:hypothetical protein
MAGGITTRSAQINSGVIGDLCGLDDTQIATLRNTYKIAQVNDLALLDKADIDAIL